MVVLVMKDPIIQMRRILKSELLKANHNMETYFLPVKIQ